VGEYLQWNMELVYWLGTFSGSGYTDFRTWSVPDSAQIVVVLVLTSVKDISTLQPYVHAGLRSTAGHAN